MYDKRSKCYVVVFRYRYTPVPSTKQSKGSIGASTRRRLWDAISRLADPGRADMRYRNRFDTEAEFLEELMYLRQRRELLLDLLGATGARPGELSELSVARNVNCGRSKTVELTTYKRRMLHLRRVPINQGLAIRLELFIKQHRRRRVQRHMDRQANFEESDRVFLSSCGHPISGATFEREFSRIVDAAGLGGERACMSMYRHRFITNMVALHLKGFMDDHPGHRRHLFTSDDYRSILHRVAAFTGHGNSESLLPYIDLAWDELGIYDGVEATKNLQDSLEGSVASLTRLVEQLQVAGGKRKGELISQINTELSALRSASDDSRLGKAS